ncbi:hypothetical protein [Pandoraea sp. NPDC087047]|uniref:hypothetical protein n=1 Tax=Pandoraea sp. NPDC087047 TaxID=3364390 RepID=UPI00382B1025
MATDLSDESSIETWLVALSRNKSLLSTHLKGEIERSGFSFDAALHNEYAFDLYRDDDITVRLIVWGEISSHAEAGNFIYGLRHSHDFELHAVGYSGDGYRTIKTEILDPSPIAQGCAPHLGREDEVKLGEGSYFHMRPFLDIHQQFPPERLSSSLSLLIHPRNRSEDSRAWCFDERFTPVCSEIGGMEMEVFREIASLIEGRDGQCSFKSGDTYENQSSQLGSS